MSFFPRLWLALVCFFKVVFDRDFAGRVAALRAPLSAPRSELEVRGTPPGTPAALQAGQPARAEPALRLLANLQREGRLVDFLEEEIAAFPDAQIGAAARAVHAGCRKALRQIFKLAPVRLEAEGGAVVIPSGFDANAVRLTGNVVGDPPFRGILRHHGWRVSETRLPSGSGDPAVVAPAEVELS